MSKKVKFLYIPVAVLVALFSAYEYWSFQRRFHYDYAYKAFVEQTVHEIVKPECFR